MGNFLFYVVASKLKSCLTQKQKKEEVFWGVKNCLFLEPAVLVIIVNGVCPLLLPLVSLLDRWSKWVNDSVHIIQHLQKPQMCLEISFSSVPKRKEFPG